MTDPTVPTPDTAPAPEPSADTAPAPVTAPPSTLLVEPASEPTVEPTASVGAAPAATDPSDGSVPPVSPTPEPELEPTEEEKKKATHKSAVAFLETAISNAIKELGEGTTVIDHGIADEFQKLKSFADYSMHALKGKLGLL